MSSFAELSARAQAAWQELTVGPRNWIAVGMGSCGVAAGSDKTLAALGEEVAKRGLDVFLGQVGCHGACFAEPIVAIQRPGEPRVIYGGLTADKVSTLLDEVVAGRHRADWALGVEAEVAFQGTPPLAEHPFFRGQQRHLMTSYGLIDPENIDHYIANGGYAALEKALSSLVPEGVIAELTQSGVGGRGGAYFSVGRKWDFLRTARGVAKYLICNADEGDPGAFVNRTTLESDPFSVIEGMTIGGFATGAAQGYIYLRAEYPFAAARLRRCLAQAREQGLLGSNVLNRGFSFDIELVVGAGSYVCGEETGLIASIQDSRGMPRIRPPYPAQSGLFWQPTNVNNVESYANVPLILRQGASWYATLGTEATRGTKLFSLSGNIARTGVVEVPLGTPVRVVVEGMGGGVPGGKALKAIQPGGPLGGIMPARALELALDRGPFGSEGALLGSGGLVAVDEDACIVTLVRLFMRFGEDESCARCTTCRIGGMGLADILDRIAAGQGKVEDLETVARLREVMQNANCAHGQGVPLAAVNLLRHFEDEVKAHILERRCPARVCPGLTSYVMIPDKCDNAAEAAAICPTSAIVNDGEYHIIDEKCVRCGACREVCGPEAVVLSTPRGMVPAAVG